VTLRGDRPAVRVTARGFVPPRRGVVSSRGPDRAHEPAPIRRASEPDTDTTGWVSVSVVVPVYNDPDGVATTIESIRPQLTDDAELVVVDNDSTDRTPAVVSEYSEADERIELRHETDVQSSYAARNRGIEASSGDLLAFVDADMTAAETWLEDLRAFVADSGAAYVGCDVEVYVPDGADSVVARYDAAKGFPVEFYVEERNYAPTCCLAVRREVVEDVGPFDATLVSGGDGEFGRRVAAAGYAQAYAPDVQLFHPARTSLRALRTKGIRVGRGQEQLSRSGDDAARPIWDPRNVLPPRPSTFRRTIAGDWGHSTLLGWFLLDYWYKLTQLRGRLHERL